MPGTKPSTEGKEESQGHQDPGVWGGESIVAALFLDHNQ